VDAGGLEAADWKARREILRALVKRVEVGTDAVKVVYKVDPRPFDQGPERGSSQDCGRSAVAFVGEHLPALVREVLW
jgi:hypothetical protein